MNCLYINQLLTKDDEVRRALLHENQIQMTGMEFCPNAYTTNDSIGALSKNLTFSKAYFYLQNPSSLLPVVALDPKLNEKILDIASAPGGKTIHIASRMKNTGQIFANDLSPARTSKLKLILHKYGVTNAEVTSSPGQMLWQKHKDEFDRVLVDAPCTMHGTDNPSTDSPKKMSKIQKSLLRSAIACCKPGGVVVYSTCTDTVEENEEVMGKIMVQEAGAIELVEVNFDQSVPRGESPKEDSKGKPFSYDTKKVFRVKRNELFEGFFVAKIRKLEVSTKTKHI